MDGRAAHSSARQSLRAQRFGFASLEKGSPMQAAPSRSATRSFHDLTVSRITTLAFALAACAWLSGFSGGPPTSLTRVELGTEAQAILRNHCAACHTPGSNAFAGVKYEGEFDAVLDFARLRESPYLDLQHPEESELYLLVAEAEMPPPKAVASGHSRVLSAAERATLLAWIRAGAPEPGAAGPTAPSRLDETLLERGASAFFAACTACHPASRALGKSKSLARWTMTVERMADKTGAIVAREDVGAIATYLAHESAKRMTVEGVEAPASPDWWEALQVNLTVSTMWRDSGHADRVENSDFVAELWGSVEWHQADGPFSARVSACTTCHEGFDDGAGPLEVVEAALRVDLAKALNTESTLRSSLEAGRFIVPFGSFSAQVNPAAYRTVTRPLLYNMGQLVDRNQIGPAILPMPYSDEGVKADVTSQLGGGVTAGLDVYVVNGLQGDFGVNFFQSRSYSDNNSDPAVGGRLAVGSPSFTVGASAMTGNSEASGSPQRLSYDVLGLDLNARIGKRVRVVAEVARRSNDIRTFVAAQPFGKVDLEGYVIESDVLLSEAHGISFVARLDATRYEGTVAPIASSLSPDFRVERFTWGFDVAVFGSSNLMINHEHWSMPEALEDVDVIGLRWVMSF